jgi:hypothetical protein
MHRVLLAGWLGVLGYCALRMTLLAAPESCPDTVWVTSDNPACDWSAADVVWYFSLPILAAATLLALIVAVVRRVRRRRRPSIPL